MAANSKKSKQLERGRRRHWCKAGLWDGTCVALSPVPSGGTLVLAMRGRLARLPPSCRHQAGCSLVVTVHEWICNCLMLAADGNYLEDIWVL